MKGWTTKELAEASKLWLKGFTTGEIADTLGRTESAMKHAIRTHRDKFPTRNEARYHGALKSLKVTMTPFMHKALEARAKERNITLSRLIREILRDAVTKGMR